LVTPVLPLRIEWIAWRGSPQISTVLRQMLSKQWTDKCESCFVANDLDAHALWCSANGVTPDGGLSARCQSRMLQLIEARDDAPGIWRDV